MNRRKMIKNVTFLSFILAAFIGIILPAPGIAADVGVMVITNHSVKKNSITQKDLEKIYLGKKTRWDNGKKIVPVILDDRDIHENFLSKYIKKSPEQFNNYWKRQVFTGRGKELKSFNSLEETIDYIKNTSGAIGYITSDPSKVNYDDLLKSVKILSLEKKK